MNTQNTRVQTEAAASETSMETSTAHVLALY
jgi:hypothetical protein